MSAAQRAAADLPQRYQTSREFVRAGAVIVDGKYQRQLDARRVTQIAERFDPDAFGYPLVRDAGGGRFDVIDGQHRIAAAVKLYGEDQLIECEVVRGIDLQRAASLFRLRNESRHVRALDKFLAGVTAGDEECVAINGIVRSAGLQVARSHGEGRGTVQAVTALQRVYRGHRSLNNGRNPLPLKRTLVVLSEAWGDGPDAFQASLINGLGLVMLRHGDVIELDELIRKLKSYTGGPLRLIGAARGLQDSIGGSTANAVATAIVHRYNHGRRSKKLPDWRASESAE